ncbi:hypothetical protein ACHAPU_000609 [Fusarium lateritium]
MHFSNLLPTLGGLVAVAQASPHLLGVGVGLGADVGLGGAGAAVGADVGVGAGAGLDVGAKTDVDAGVDADAGVKVGAGVKADAGLDADAGAKVGAGVKADADADVDAGAGAKVGAGVKTDAGLDAGADVGAKVGADAGAKVGAGAGLDVDADANVSVGKGHSSKPLVGTKVAPATCSLANSWEDHVLFKGIAAPAVGASAAVHLGLNLPKAQISGDVQLDLVKDFLQEPRIRIGLGGVKAYVEIDISASAAVHESIELFASPALDLEIPGLLEVEAGAAAAVALDLVVGVNAAIDLSAGVYLAFGEEAFVEVSLLTKEIVDVSLEGLVTKALPIGVAADVDLSAEVALQLGLRLRTEVDINAEVEIPVLEIEAGAKVAAWVSLFEYTAALVSTDNCAVSIDEVIALTLGLAVDLDVEVGDILDLSLAPALTVTLATAAKAKVCQADRGVPGIFLEGKDASPAKTSTHVVSLATASAGDKSSAATDAYPAPEATGADAYPVVDGSSAPAGDETTAATDAYPAPEATATGAYPVVGGSSAKAETTKAPIVPAGHNGTTTGDVTRTLTSTQVYTITSCAASVINCPARYTQKVVTSTIIESTYVCPATETGAVPAMTTSHPKVPVPVTTITDTLTTVVPCKTRTTNTFQPPTAAPPAPTVTIVDSTTYCPEADKTGHSAVPTTFQAVTTAPPKAPVTESHEKPTPEVPNPQKPTADKPIVPPVQSVYVPHGNGTVPTPPVAPVPVPTGNTVVPHVPTGNTVVPPVPTGNTVVPPVVSNPPHPAYPAPSKPVGGVPVVPTPVTTPVVTPVPVSGGNVLRTGLMLAIPAVVAIFM